LDATRRPDYDCGHQTRRRHLDVFPALKGEDFRLLQDDVMRTKLAATLLLVATGGAQAGETRPQTDPPRSSEGYDPAQTDPAALGVDPAKLRETADACQRTAEVMREIALKLELAGDQASAKPYWGQGQDDYQWAAELRRLADEAEAKPPRP
jgi:hypothetical protein